MRRRKGIAFCLALALTGSAAASPELAARALAGAILMVLADIASRLLIAPQSLPVGVVTALVGVPFFAVTLYRSGHRS